MNRYFFVAAFLLGALAVFWVSVGFVGANSLALLITLIIGMVYVAGTLELRRFRDATSTLANALDEIPTDLPNLGDWVEKLHPSLQNTVRLRIEGERVGLPGPALTPYLVGLLVMLGMLGTFIGMVVTLHGAVFALESTTDIQAIRAALAAPVKGLGLAFGTSVAGVATSAMLGLMSALSRRERLLVVQILDTKIATVLRTFSLAYQRQEAFKALQLQAHTLPEVADKLQAMMEQMERRNQQLNEHLLTNQNGFNQEVKDAYTSLASSVEKTLNDSLTTSIRIAGDSVRPIVDAAMKGIAQETRLLHERMVGTTQAQFNELAGQFAANAARVTETCVSALASNEGKLENLMSATEQSLNDLGKTFDQRSALHLTSIDQAFSKLQSELESADQQRMEAWRQSLESIVTRLQYEWRQLGTQTLSHHQQVCATLEQTTRDITEQAQVSASRTLDEIGRLLNCSDELIRSRIDAEADWVKQHGDRLDQLTRQWRAELGALRDDEARRGDAAVERLGELQKALKEHLSTLGVALEAPITRLLQTASEAPRAAAEVIAELRREMSNGIARDNAVLEERNRIMETLNSLLAGINHASTEQRTAIDSLVASAGALLNGVSHQFTEKVAEESSKIAETAGQVTGSAVELSALSEAFSFSMQLFSDANEKLIANLQRIEAAMEKSIARSDDQLAYYVAQAREIIDLSMMSHKEVVENLRQLASEQKLLSEGVS